VKPSRTAPDPALTTRTHALEVRVRYAETDQIGVVHHASYALYLEEGRTALMAELGCAYHQLEQRGVGLVVRRLELRYRAPARYGDVVRVVTGVSALRAASVTFEYRLERAADGLHLADASTELACVDLASEARGPRALPEDVRASMLVV
jgi:acyl-CoA thioester hydrolase